MWRGLHEIISSDHVFAHSVTQNIFQRPLTWLQYPENASKQSSKTKPYPASLNRDTPPCVHTVWYYAVLYMTTHDMFFLAKGFYKLETIHTFWATALPSAKETGGPHSLDRAQPVLGLTLSRSGLLRGYWAHGISTANECAVVNRPRAEKAHSKYDRAMKSPQ